MTEKEKMILGLEYHALDISLDQDRQKAKTLCYQMNQLPPTHRHERSKLLQEIISCDSTAFIEQPFHCAYGYNIHVGKNFLLTITAYF